MIVKTNLYDLVSLWDNPDLSEKYVRFELQWNKTKKYRHDEIIQIRDLINTLSLQYEQLDGFIYSYQTPQICKEFDLLKIDESNLIDIEIKGENPSKAKILKQLQQNRHYLGILNRSSRYFCYVQKEKTILELLDNDLREITIDDLKSAILLIKDNYDINLDEQLSANHFLVSPLNSTINFLNNQYFLTEQQRTFKDKIFEILNNPDCKFIGLTGNAGTGKTLLLYDIAKELMSKYKVLIIHCGILCVGHDLLKSDKFDIISIKELKGDDKSKLDILSNHDIILIDETQRIYKSQFEFIKGFTLKNNVRCIFSFDENQTLTKSEKRNEISKEINDLCGKSIYKLSNKIRINREIASFIRILFGKENIQPNQLFSNVKLYYKPKNLWRPFIDYLENKQGYVYIPYTPSMYNFDYYEYNRDTSTNTHHVIGQEFNKVVMVLGDMFYFKDGKLSSFKHPNSDYLYTSLLYQGLTRTRNELALVITQESLFSSILDLFNFTKK